MQHILSQAQQFDNEDVLKEFRNEFYLPQGIYMDGNSLGLLSYRAEKYVSQILDDWKKLGIGGWTQGKNPWFYLPEKLAELTAPLIGASPEEIIVTNSVSINLHQILATFYHPENDKKIIITDEYAFPTDMYAIQSWITQRNGNLQQDIKIVSAKNRILEEDDIIALMDQYADQVALVVLPVVVYTTGQQLNVAKITEAAHKRNIVVCFDASHSIGSVAHNFHEIGVDFGVWCNYKYLNAGPGAVGGMYVHEKYLKNNPGLGGWFGSDKTKQFDMAHTPTYATTAGKYQIGTPHILSMAPLLGSLELFHEASMDRLREKSLRLTDYLWELINTELSLYDFKIVTPENHERRGGHIALAHPQAIQINQALQAQGVIPDFRPPDMIRLAPISFYTRFEDVYHVVEILKSIMEQQTYKKFSHTRGIIA